MSGAAEQGQRRRLNDEKSWKTNCSLCVYRTFRLFLDYFLKEASSKDKPHSLHQIDFGFEPCLSASTTNNNPHLVGPKQEGGRRQPRPDVDYRARLLFTRCWRSYSWHALVKFNQHLTITGCFSLYRSSVLFVRFQSYGAEQK